ncbi:MAG: DUF1800 domain-containing protein [Crocinitomicaceae bacterium]|nr:DUF1800 domain-containing protein [Crocinitomicaceae bacterium]
MRSILSVILLAIATLSYSQTPPSNYSMSPYSGPWTGEEAGHLLRRTLFGPTRPQILNSIAIGMDSTVEQLLVATPWTDFPLVYQDVDSNAAIGTSWVSATYPPTNKGGVNNTRLRSLAAWKMKKMMEETSTIAQKMDVFWHNHFAVSQPSDARTFYDYFELIRSHTLGNFKTLVKEMTIQPAMLQFLNGEDNVSNDPNENYSRELLELYSIGKGIEIATGDYSRYTEQDVTEGARILTGYSNVGIRSETIADPYSVFDPVKHDNTPKTLSYHFGGATIMPNGITEYEDYIDTIFAQPDFASFICESIYHFFVSNDITPTVQNQVISEMANTLVSNNFEIRPVMLQLLKSQHFYDVALRGCLMKSPMDFLFSIYNSIEAQVNFNQVSDYKILYKIHYDARQFGMNILEPPSVAGWPAYYQAPAFSRYWLSAVYLQKRYAMIDAKILGNGYNADGNVFEIDGVSLLNTLTNPYDANAVLDDLFEIFLSIDVSQSDRTMLLDILTDGLPIFEWTVLYNDYLLDPVTYGVDINNQITNTIAAIFKLYIFQTL